MAEVKKEVKEFGPYPSRYPRELVSEYRSLKNSIEQYSKRGEPLPPAIVIQLPKFQALRASLSRMGIKA